MTDPYEIAVWRYLQIAPLLDPSLARWQRRALLGEQKGDDLGAPPGSAPGKRRKPSHSTLNRWARLYRAEGLAGLVPQPRRRRAPDCSADAALSWVTYAIGLLYEQPSRTLTQLDVYLRTQFEDYSFSRSTLARRLKAHPAYAGIQHLRRGISKKQYRLYEARHPHECWQLDGKGPFWVRLKSGRRIRVHVLSILDDCSRSILAAVIAPAENTAAAMRVFRLAVLRWGVPDRMQFDRGSAFDSEDFRRGLAQCGVHRNAVKARTPTSQGKVEAYHRVLDRWFIEELRAQEVLDEVHLEELLQAMLALVYQPHRHREIGTSPEAKLTGQVSDRRLTESELSRAFSNQVSVRSEKKTGRVNLPGGVFVIPAAFVRRTRHRVRYDLLHPQRAFLITPGGKEVELAPFERLPLPPMPPAVTEGSERRGAGQLQKLVDRWRGRERPNAEAGFGLPEVFAQLGVHLGREVPASDSEAARILAFYHRHGPLAREPFLRALQRAFAELGQQRALRTYLDHLERQLDAAARSTAPDPGASPSEEVSASGADPEGDLASESAPDPDCDPDSEFDPDPDCDPDSDCDPDPEIPS